MLRYIDCVVVHSARRTFFTDFFAPLIDYKEIDSAVYRLPDGVAYVEVVDAEPAVQTLWLSGQDCSIFGSDIL